MPASPDRHCSRVGPRRRLEALLGARPTAGERPLPSSVPGREKPPRWLRRVLERGLQPDPVRRRPALAIWETALGPEHPEVGIGLSNLGA